MWKQRLAVNLVELTGEFIHPPISQSSPPVNNSFIAQKVKYKLETIENCFQHKQLLRQMQASKSAWAAITKYRRGNKRCWPQWPAFSCEHLASVRGTFAALVPSKPDRVLGKPEWGEGDHWGRANMREACAILLLIAGGTVVLDLMDEFSKAKWTTEFQGSPAAERKENSYLPSPSHSLYLTFQSLPMGHELPWREWPKFPRGTWDHSTSLRQILSCALPLITRELILYLEDVLMPQFALQRGGKKKKNLWTF